MKKNHMNVHYDAEADFLEITLSNSSEGYYKDLGEGITERIDEKSGKVAGIAILNFKKKVKEQRDIKIPLIEA